MSVLGGIDVDVMKRLIKKHEISDKTRLYYNANFKLLRSKSISEISKSIGCSKHTARNWKSGKSKRTTVKYKNRIIEYEGEYYDRVIEFRIKWKVNKGDGFEEMNPLRSNLNTNPIDSLQELLEVIEKYERMYGIDNVKMIDISRKDISRL